MANNKINIAKIVESWGPAVKAMTNNSINESSDRFQWLCEYAHNHTMAMNEDAAIGAPGFPMQNLTNTNGIGNAVPASTAGMTAVDRGLSTSMGSGDKWPTLLPMALQVAARTIGFDLVNTIPTPGPTYVIPFLDYVYSGSKDAYGATPSYNGPTANPTHGPNGIDNIYETYEAPFAFRCKITENASKANYIKAIKDQDASNGKFTLTANGVSMDVNFISLTRLGADPMFRVLPNSKGVSLGKLFGPDASINVTATDDSSTSYTFYLHRPRLVSALEDQIQGYTGSGKWDSDRWTGTFQNDQHLYEPMDRGTGELQYPRQMSLKVFTKWGQVGTQSIAVAVTQEQVQDLQKQWGIDVLKLVENAAINELSQSINKHILSRLFALGWRNHVEAYEAEGINLNINLVGSTGVTKTCVTYFDDVANEKLVTMNVPALQNYGNFENLNTTFEKVMMNLGYGGNIIMNRGRRGPANFIVCNAKIATMLQVNSQYSFAPIANTINQNTGSLYPTGTLMGMTVYVDPLMAMNDTRILIGRKGGKDEPGVVFCPYIMAESVKLITEMTASPKVIVKSRYVLADVGFYPELNYLTMFVNMPDALV